MANDPHKQTLSAHITVRDAHQMMELYKRAFGAEEIHRAQDPSGKVMHATMRIGDSMFSLNDEYPDRDVKAPLAYGGSAVTLNLNYESAEKVDAAWKRAVDAGVKVTMPIANQFWGGRYGMLEDASGHKWALHAQVENPSEEEIAKRAAAMK